MVAIPQNPFATPRDLGRLLSKKSTELLALKAHFHNVVEDELYSILRGLYTLTGRAVSGISDDEAREAFRSTESLFKAAVPPAPKKEGSP